MTRRSARLPSLLVVAAAVVIANASAAAQGQASALRVTPCTQGRTKVAAECGTFRVYEDRRARSGRTIELHFVVLRAEHPGNRAIYLNLGGPGAPTLGYAALVADGQAFKELAALRDRYDILFLDNRGMGESHPLTCNLTPPTDPGSYFRQLWPSELVLKCRRKLTANSALATYTTSNAADDLDDVRAALGYPKLVLEGGSYGTYFALVYARRHPGHVESAILQGVVPPHLSDLLLGFASAAQSALDKLAAECKSDPTCDRNFPEFQQHFAAIAQRLDRGQIPVRVYDTTTKHEQTVLLSKEVFADSVRHLLYNIDAAVYLPFIIERAYRGDTLPLGTMVDDVAQGFAQELNQGSLLSYSCAEYVHFVTEAAVRAASAGTFMGDSRVRAQQHACAIWDVPPASSPAPVRSDAPILMVSGANDPATPPRYSAEQLMYLPNARRVVIRGASHDSETACGTRLIVEFVRKGTAKGLNLDSCSSGFTRPAFATSMAGFENH